ncbi:MAG: dTDP-4-amino-4,6-dideoxygalactose transaminase [Bacteroidetes bacterium]|nr:dTDP-4-amino-4,6-dideoxygalactose transaminase [Bacteroidota bacterium]MBS1740073.1 dTDP-4-amino-4,6-dideoxygalactose transaminase [Bacteroidota bacterium]
MKEQQIPFNKPFLTGKELQYIEEAVKSGKISGDGMFTKKCHSFFEERYCFRKCLLTTSCTDALEMAAILINTAPGDEIIVPAFTFVSTVNAFVLRGATIIFADSNVQEPNIDVSKISDLITPKTKAIIAVHYAGVACDLDAIYALAKKHGLFVIEDAAQAIDSYYKGVPLGSIGDLAAFSFHETKNVISGEGGMLVVNNPTFESRSEIIREKGTNRSSFFRGEVDKYGWVDLGSSFLPSEIISAFLFAQLEHLDTIQTKRKALWHQYHHNLESLENEGKLQRPYIPDYATCNGHMYYIILPNVETRTALIKDLQSKGIHSVFHYLSLHQSPYFKDKHDGRELPQSVHYTNCLLRLPLFYELTLQQVDFICEQIGVFFSTHHSNLLSN